MEQERMDLLYKRYCEEEFDKNGVRERPLVCGTISGLAVLGSIRE